MPALSDEMILNVDGILSVDPAITLRDRAHAFIASREWSTHEIFYGDQPEPEYSEDRPMWSMGFCLGLDHVPTTTANWFADVAAILGFVQEIAREHACEFIVEFRLRSRLWYSETLEIIDDNPNQTVDLEVVYAMLTQFMQPKLLWWRDLIRRWIHPIFKSQSF